MGQQFRKRSCRHVPAYMIFRNWSADGSLEEETGTAPEAELEELLQKNPEICIVTNELGYGVVPIEPFDRKWREKTGRICTELAAKADSVTRVVCGIGILLKGEEKHD